MTPALSLKTRPLGFKSTICTFIMRTQTLTIPTTFVMGYVFVPISTMGSSILSSFRTHLRYSSRFSYSVDHPELYHRRPMEINTGVSVEFLYARFAYNIIIIRILQADPLIHLATKIKIPISLLHRQATNSRYKSGRRFWRDHIWQRAFLCEVCSSRRHCAPYTLSLTLNPVQEYW